MIDKPTIVTPPETDEQRAERERTVNPFVSLWRSMSGTALDAARRQREAEERTGAIDPGTEPAPVVGEED